MSQFHQHFGEVFPQITFEIPWDVCLEKSFSYNMGDTDTNISLGSFSVDSIPPKYIPRKCKYKKAAYVAFVRNSCLKEIGEIDTLGLFLSRMQIVL